MTFEKIEEELLGLSGPTNEELNELFVKDYTKQDKYANTAYTYFDEICKIPLATPEEIALWVTERDKAKERKDMEAFYEARNKIVIHNLRLVKSIAQKFSRDVMKVPDYVGYGQIGLIVAAEKFTLERGCKFSTYATWWIRQAVIRSVENDHVIRLPVHINDKLNRVIRFVNRYYMEHGCEPTLEEQAEATGLSQENILNMLQKSTVDSLSRPIKADDNEDSTIGQFVADEVDIEQDTITKMMVEELMDRLEKVLKPRELTIIKLRYGLDDGKAKTLEEVGKRLGITRERVRQVEAKAIRRLKCDRRLREIA